MVIPHIRPKVLNEEVPLLPRVEGTQIDKHSPYETPIGERRGLAKQHVGKAFAPNDEPPTRVREEHGQAMVIHIQRSIVDACCMLLVYAGQNRVGVRTHHE